MATIKEELFVAASVENVWDAARDVGALATRLVPGFVTEARLEGNVRIVTFANGITVREPIVTIDEDERRLVWSAEGGVARHYNASLQVFPKKAAAAGWSGSRISCLMKSRRVSAAR